MMQILWKKNKAYLQDLLKGKKINPKYSINLERRSKHLIKEQYNEIQFSENLISKKTNWK